MRVKLFLPLLLLAGCASTVPLSIADFKLQLEPSTQIVVRQKPVEMVALRYIGYAEKTHRAELKELLGVDPKRTEWCAAFVNAVLAESGIPGSDTVSQYPLTARSFLDWGVRVKDPQPGDIVVFPRGREAWQGHVGFYLRTQIIDGIKYYYILGGNQSNKVSIDVFRASSAISIRRFAA